MKSKLTPKRRWLIGLIFAIILSICYHYTDDRTLAENWRGRLLIFVVPAVGIPNIIKSNNQEKAP